jgi:hypothetical protein
MFEGLLSGTFSYQGTATLADNSGSSQARFDTDTSMLEIDVDGDGAVEMAIKLTNVISTDLDDTDFNWS